MSSHRECDSSHSQKFSLRTSDSFPGMPTASRTCSRRYSSVGVIGRLGFVLIQTDSSFQLSQRAQPSTGATWPVARHAAQASSWQIYTKCESLGATPSSTWSPYACCCQQTDVRSCPAFVMLSTSG